MAKKVISIDIGQQFTKVAVVDYGRKNPKVYNCFAVESPKSAVEDGYIRDKTAFTTVIKDRLTKIGIREKEAVFTISSTRIVNREIIIPSVPKSKIQPILESVAQDHFPVDVTEYTFTYSILERINTAEQKGIKLLAIAAPNNLIQSYYELAELLGVSVVAVDYIGNSTYQVVKKQVERGITMTVQINEKATFINIIDNDNMTLQRMIPVGTVDVVDRLLKHKIFEVTDYKEAYDLLCKEKIINPSFDIGNNEVAATMYISNDAFREEVVGKKEVTDSLQNLLSNISRVFDFYNSKYPEKRVTGIYVSGDGAKFRSITKLIYNETGIETQRVKSVLGVTFDPSIRMDQFEQTQFMGAIGAAIAPIGFLSSDRKAGKASASTDKTISLLVFGSVVASVLMIVASFAILGLATMEKSDLESRIEQLKPIEQLYNQYQNNVAEFDNVYKMHMASCNMNVYLNEVFQELEAHFATTIDIKSINSDGKVISMNISGTSKSDIAKSIQSLKESKYFSDIQISGLSQTVGEMGNTQVTTAMTITLNDEIRAEEEKKLDTEKE